jgi:hypothetical protein
MGVMAYLPKYAGDERAELARRGLGSLLDPGIDAIFTEVRKGPDGGHGKLVTFWPGNSPREVCLESQTWMEAPPDGDFAKGRYWVGYVRAQKPSAGELQRRELIDGEPVALADGNAWIVPCCEFAPKRLTRDRNTGAETRVVKDEYQHWVDWSNALYRVFVSDAFHTLVEKQRIVHIPNGLGFAALCLAQNYRVNQDVVDLLGLIGEYEAFEIARVATGMSIMERLLVQKKSTEPSSLEASLS